MEKSRWGRDTNRRIEDQSYRVSCSCKTERSLRVPKSPLPVHEEPPPPAEGTTFVPVSNFGEKRVHAITKRTMVKVVKAVETVAPVVVAAPTQQEGVEFAYKIS